MLKQKSGYVQRPLDFAKRFREFRLHTSEQTEVIKQYFVSLDTPISLSCYILYSHGEFDQLVEKELDPHNYEDPDLFRRDFAAISLLRKSDALKTSHDKEASAISTFEKAELQCSITNQAIKSYLNGKNNCPCEPALHAAIRKIERILREFRVDELLDLADWGPGASLSVKGKDTSAPRKFDEDRDITRAAYTLFGDVSKLAYPTWKAWDEPNLVESNTIITVPKNAKTNRTIAIEPGLNLWFQKATGLLIRRRMRACGFNLNSDLKNHRGAYIGSIDGSLTTVDFSSASDTISTETVRLLLPPLWFSVADSLRSHSFTFNKQVSRYHKFSSMGNGFTWELESLIFCSCALACCEVLGLDDSAVSVFGDDIIIPSEAYAMYTSLVEFLGFTINKKKSYNSSWFRESCGSFYFKGVDVKPIFLRSDFSRCESLYVLLNRIRDFAHRCNNYTGCDVRLKSVWRLALAKVPASLRLFGPVSSGNGTINDNIEASVGAKVAAHGWEGFTFPAIVMRPRTVRKDTHGVLLHKVNSILKSPSDRLEGNDFSLRRLTTPVLKKRMLCSQWYELGPWI